MELFGFAKSLGIGGSGERDKWARRRGQGMGRGGDIWGGGRMFREKIVCGRAMKIWMGDEGQGSGNKRPSFLATEGVPSHRGDFRNNHGSTSEHRELKS